MEQYVDEEIYEEENVEESLFSKIWKPLKYILIVALIVLIIFSIINNLEKSKVEENASTSKTIFTQEYIVTTDLTTDERVY
jgi:hypothetical protein